MKKLLTTALMLGSVTAVAACTANGVTELDETRTAAPYAEERTVGYEPYSPPPAPAPVRSAEPVFQRANTK